jgi:putative ABC transport system ATP-binding protein
MAGPAALQARSLYRFYRVGDDETLALQGVSLTIEEGGTVAITGPSGSGKSTLMACLAGLDEPDGGAVHLAGKRLSHRPERQRAAARAAGIGVMWQNDNLVRHLTVTDNIRLAQLLARGIPRTRSTPAQLLHAVGLGNRGHARPTQLSGGEAARAALAVAVANAPAVLLADEPTGELDEGTESLVLHVLREQALRGCAIVLASHSAAVAAVADRVLRLVQGRLVTEAA